MGERRENLGKGGANKEGVRGNGKERSSQSNAHRQRRYLLTNWVETSVEMSRLTAHREDQISG